MLRLVQCNVVLIFFVKSKNFEAQSFLATGKLSHYHLKPQRFSDWTNFINLELAGKVRF